MLSAAFVYYYEDLTMPVVVAGYSYLFISFLITQYFYEVGKRKEMSLSKSKMIRPEAVPSHRSVTA
jgi:hypothetical protein